MMRLFAAGLERLDASYRGQPFFLGQRARLLAAFNLLLLVLMPINVVKLLCFPLPHLTTRIALNIAIAIVAALSLRTVMRGGFERAGNTIVLLIVLGLHGSTLVFENFGEPLSTAIQMMAFDLVFLIFAVAFAEPWVVVVVLVTMMAGHVVLYLKALQIGRAHV